MPFRWIFGAFHLKKSLGRKSQRKNARNHQANQLVFEIFMRAGTLHDKYKPQIASLRPAAAAVKLRNLHG